MNNLKKFLVSIPVLVLLTLFLTIFASAEEMMVGVTTGEGINVRVSPDLSSDIITQLSKNVKISITEEKQDWYRISHEEVAGWVSSKYVKIVDEPLGSGTIKGNNVNVRSGPSTDEKIITTVDKGEAYNYYKRAENWYCIKLKDGQTGWVIKDYFLVRGTSTASRGAAQDAKTIEAPAEEKSGAAESTADKLIAFAKKLLGVRYVYGGSSPKGFDCSGFTSYVFSNFGISLARSSSAQAKGGTAIKKSQLQAGDLVFFTSPGHPSSVGHTGIYIGDGKFIHASSSSSSKKVIISDLTSGTYAKRYLSARRYLK